MNFLYKAPMTLVATSIPGQHRGRRLKTLAIGLSSLLLLAITSPAHAIQVVTNPPTSNWGYGYDPLGNLTTVTDPFGKTSYIYYAALGRPIQTQQPINGGQSITQMSYDGADNLSQVADPRNLQTRYTPTGVGTVTQQTSPDTGTAHASFDAEGKPLTTTDARGKTTKFHYDSLSRLVALRYASGTGTTIEYDGGATPIPAAIGKVSKITDESGHTSYTYDSAQRLTSKIQITNGKTIKVGYTWGDSGSALDKITAITYPSGSRVNFAYDSFGTVSGITLTPVNANGTGLASATLPLLSGITLNAATELTGWSWASGKTQAYTHDQFGRLNGYKLGDPTGAGFSAGSQRTMGMDAAGNITSYTHTSNGASVAALDQAFAYDDLTRLISASIGNSSIQYSFDANGNRASKVISGTAYNNNVSPSSNQLIQTQDVEGVANIQYDAAGNVTNDGTNSYTYSDRGRLSSVTVAGGVVHYRYNGLEQRTHKSGPASVIPSGHAYYVYDEAGQLLGEYEANGTPLYETIYLGATPVGVLKQTGAAAHANIATHIFHVYADHLNTPRVITRDTDEAIVWRWDSAEAFGATAPNQNPNGLGTFVFNQRLPGQVYDKETGLFQNWHREYNARLGRYIESDPIGLRGGINTYGYVGGNPLSFVDPRGLMTFESWWEASKAGWQSGNNDPWGELNKYLQGMIPGEGAAVSAIGQGLTGIKACLTQAPKASALAANVSAFWSLNPFARGKAIEQALGQNLPGNFPVIDRFENGLATSIKSLDLNAATYQIAAALDRTITRYIDSVANFAGRSWAGVNVPGSAITGRALDLAIPSAGSAAQQSVIAQAVQYGASLGVTVNVIVFP